MQTSDLSAEIPEKEKGVEVRMSKKHLPDG